MYTFEDMTTKRDVYVVKNEDGTSTEVWNTAFALLNENNKPVIQIYDFDNRKFIEGSFVLDTTTMIAMEEEKFESRKDKDGKVDIGIDEGIRVEADLDQGIWFAA